MLNDLTVFACPAATNIIENNEMLLTYKNQLQGLDVSIAFGVLTELTASLTYPQFYVDGNIAVVEDSMLITREFIRLLTLLLIKHLLKFGSFVMKTLILGLLHRNCTET